MLHESLIQQFQPMVICDPGPTLADKSQAPTDRTALVPMRIPAARSSWVRNRMPAGAKVSQLAGDEQGWCASCMLCSSECKR